MSSAPSEVSTAGRGIVPRSETVRSELHQHLRKTAQFIKILDTLVILFAWIAGALTIWLGACVVDHWLYPLPAWARWMVWSCGMTATAWWSVRYLLPLLSRRINPVYAARRIEHLVPEFKNGLVSWLELESLPDHGVPRGVMAALTYRAARFIGGQDPSATVDTSQLIKLLGGVLLLATSLVVYTMLSPKSTFVTGQRIAMPWLDIAAPTRVHLLAVEPGQLEITQGKPLPIEVKLRGLYRDEPVVVRYSTLDGQLKNRRIELAPETEGFRYTGSLATSASGIEHELDYWVEAGDARGGPFRVTLNPLPTVSLNSIALEFPAYTKLPPRSVASGGNVEAIEGTRATLSATANQTMTRGRLEIEPETDAKGELVRAQAFTNMQVDGSQLHSEWLLQLNEANDNPSLIHYRIRGYNERGDANPRPILHTIQVFADVPPEITLLGPDSRILRVAPDARVNLEIRASDPDFGLTQVVVDVRRNNIPAQQSVLLESGSPADGVLGRQVKNLRLDVGKLGATLGDQFQILAVARDNRHDPKRGQPAPNQTQSEPLLLQIVGPEQADAPEKFVSPPGAEAATPPGSADEGASANAQASGDPSASGNATGNPNAAAPPRAGDAPSTANPSPDNTGGGDATDAGQSGDGSPQAAGKSGSPSAAADASNSPATPGGASSGGSQSNDPSNNQSAGQASGGGTSGQQSSSTNQSSGNAASNRAAPSSSGQADGNTGRSSSGTPDSQGNSGTPNNSAGASGDPAGQAGDSAGQPTTGQAQTDRRVIEQVQQYIKNRQPGQQNQSTAESQAGSQQAGSQQAGSQQAGSQQAAGQQQPSGQQAGGEQAGGQQAGGQQAGGQQAGGEQAGGQQAGGQQAGGQQAGGQQAGGEQAGGQQAGGQQAGGQQAGGQQAGGQQAGGQQAGGQQAGGQQAGGQQAGGQQAGGQQAGGQQAGGQQAGGQQAGGQQAGGQQAGGQQAGGQQAGGQQAGGQQAGGQQAGGQQAGGQQAGGQQAGGQQAGGQQAGGQQAGGQQAGGQQAGGQQAGGQQAGGQQAGGQQAGGQQAGGQQAGGQQAGGEQAGGQQAGGQQAGGQQAGGQQAGGQQAGGQQAGGQQAGGQQAGGQQAGGEQAGGQQAGKAAGSSSGEGGTASGAGAGSPQGGVGGDVGGGEAANAQYAEQTTQLVLDYLNRQKDQPDPELLRELNWSQDDLQRFLSRWNSARDLASSSDPAERQSWQQQLEALNLRPTDRGGIAGSSFNDTFRQQQDGGSRIRPPESLRKQYEAFQRALQERGR